MNRRLMMTQLGLGGAMLPLMSLADTKIAPAAVSSALEDYRQASLILSTISRRASNIALQRATNPDVQQFVTLELAEQTTLEQILNNSLHPPLVSLSADDEAALQHLESRPTGRQFDQAYVAAENAGHQKLLAVQDQLIAKESISTDIAHIAYFMRVFINEHLYLLSRLS